MKLLLKIVLVLALVAGVVVYLNRDAIFPPTNEKEITLFSLSYNGDDSFYRLSLSREGQNAQVTLEAPFVPGSSVSLKTDAGIFDSLQDVVKKNKLDSWNGFDKEDTEVLDGSGFTLVIEYSDGSSVRASGSNAFPEGYQQAMKQITETISKNVFSLIGLGNIKLPF